MKKKIKGDPNKKKISWKVIVGFILFQIIFAAILGPILLYHGPFQRVKKEFVTTLEQTYTKKWINRIFLSEEKIAELTGANEAVDEDAFKEQEVEIDLSKITSDDVKAEKLKVDGATGYVITVSDPKMIKIGVTKYLNSMGQTTSDIASDNGAIAAVNGGGFYDKSGASKHAGTGGIPIGIAIQDGKIIKDQDKKPRTVFGFTESGVMKIGKYSAKELIDMGVKQALSFDEKSILVKDGVIRNTDGGLNPRTAIGQKKDGTVVLVVIDGRDFEKLELGVSTGELAKIMKNKLDVVNAFNLDGGKSSTMYYEGEVINDPSEPSGERAIPTAVIVVPNN